MTSPAVENKIKQIQRMVTECADIPKPNLMNGQRSKAVGKGHGSDLVWLAMAFESVSESFVIKPNEAFYRVS